MTIQIHTLRLKPGQDLLKEIEMYLETNAITAGCIVSAVGSFTHATLRLANQNHYDEYDGFFEIVSITGTVSTNGSHIHISISDSTGKTSGGHLVQGCTIYTTCEIVILQFTDVVYQREFCPMSGYEELTISQKA